MLGSTSTRKKTTKGEDLRVTFDAGSEDGSATDHSAVLSEDEIEAQERGLRAFGQGAYHPIPAQGWTYTAREAPRLNAPARSAMQSLCLPDPTTFEHWGGPNADPYFWDQVMILRTWVLSQPVRLDSVMNATNPPIIDALATWYRGKWSKRVTAIRAQAKKQKRELTAEEKESFVFDEEFARGWKRQVICGYSGPHRGGASYKRKLERKAHKRGAHGTKRKADAKEPEDEAEVLKDPCDDSEEEREDPKPKGKKRRNEK